MPAPIRELAESFLRDPVLVKIKAATVTIDLVEQEYIELPDMQKFDCLCRLLDMENPELAIVFVRTKRRADEVTEALKSAGIWQKVFMATCLSRNAMQSSASLKKAQLIFLWLLTWQHEDWISAG